MAARGLRDTNDLDLVVTPELFGPAGAVRVEHQAASQWQARLVPRKRRSLSRRQYAYIRADTAWLIEHAEYAQGIRLVDLDTLVGWKRIYGREKDLRDVANVEANRRSARGLCQVASCCPETDASDQFRFLAIIRSNYANDQILRRLPELGLPDSLLLRVLCSRPSGTSGPEKCQMLTSSTMTSSTSTPLIWSWEAEDAVIAKANRVFGDLGVPVQVRNQARGSPLVRIEVRPFPASRLSVPKMALITF